MDERRKAKNWAWLKHRLGIEGKIERRLDPDRREVVQNEAEKDAGSARQHIDRGRVDKIPQ